MAEDDNYYYEDFTTVTPWETFVHNLEKIFTSWKLSDHEGFSYSRDDFDGSWQCQSELIQWDGLDYTICYYSLQKSPNQLEQDGGDGDSNQELRSYLSSSIHHIFLKGTGCPPVAYMFDVPEFILLKSKNSILNESLLNQLLSSVILAISSVRCGLPVFVQARDQMEKFYEGAYIKKKFVGDFEMVHLAKPSEHCQYLSGVLDVFKSKVKPNRTTNTVSVSACFSYTIPKSSTWLGFKIIQHIPLGLACDPVCGLNLSAIWFDSSERLLSDSPTFSGLEPKSSNYHRISLIKAYPPPQGRLCGFLHRIFNLSSIALNNVDEYLNEQEWIAIVERSSVGISDITEFLDFCTESFESTRAAGNSLVPCLRDVKTAPPNGLVQALALMILRAADDIPTVRCFWGAFVDLLRGHWQRCEPLPGVGDGEPDPTTCVLHQKLQMLNFCIKRKLADLAGPDKFFDADLSDQESEGEDEFIECKDKSESEEPPPPKEPEGRKEIIPDLLILSTGEPVYAPFVQEVVRLEEGVEVARLAELNENAALSDMEAFKAANPSAFFRDFIRWFSPRDWIEEENAPTDQWGQKQGHLSSRMLVPGNKWISLWSRAKPKPVSQQPSIFDVDVHVDAILKWFESMTGYRLVLNVFPVLAQKAVERLVLDEEAVIVREILAEHFVSDLCAELKVVAEQTTRSAAMGFLDKLHEVEVQAAEVLSVCDLLKTTGMQKPSEDCHEERSKYGNIKGAVSSLVSGNEVNLSRLNGLLEILALSKEYEKYNDDLPAETDKYGKKRQFNSFPRPNRKEFILSVVAPRPGPNSKPSLQRMYASVQPDELTMAASFTKDIYYR